MGRRSFLVYDIVELFRQWQAGRGVRAIARSLGIDRKTIRKYLDAAAMAGLSPGEERSVDEWAAFIRDQFPKLVDARQRSRRSAELDRYQDFIREGLQQNRMSTVHRRLVERTGLEVSVATFRRYVHTTMPELLRTSPMPIWRPEVDPGEEAQVDFGYMGSWQDPVTGKNHRVYAFVLVLSYSRHMFVRLVLRLDAVSWQQCHIEALAFLGAVPQRIILDNLKDGVVKPDLYDPTLNRSYAELAAHYGFLIDPARQGHPKDKPRVERPIPYIRDSLWRGEQFLSLDAMNQAALGWCREVAGPRIHGTAHQRPLEVFRAEEKPAMAPLPERPASRAAPGRRSRPPPTLTAKWPGRCIRSLTGCGACAWMSGSPTASWSSTMTATSSRPMCGVLTAGAQRTSLTCLRIARPSSSTRPSCAFSGPGRWARALPRPYAGS